MPRRPSALVLVLPALCLASLAMAQSTGNQPIDITASNLSVDQKGSTATFSGNVKVVQGTTTLTSDKLTANYQGGSIETITATGNVRVVRDNKGVNEVATGSSGTYRPGPQLLTLNGSGGSGVTLTRGANVLRGRTLTYNMASGQVSLSGGGGVSGRFVSGGSSSMPQLKSSAPGAADTVSRSFNIPGR